ncbi:LysR family transcriptional regulator [Herbaspirillum autotrophicum]|uniref:LysR family transcriptional regulator n=1 Tax=Herbaspirillum autotrophicum TaxID=180195 RepID=UPI00067A9A2B|nr:LysR substrate-binding domain-containing protein [Herbaspirillum autotrophicum]
MKFKLRQMEVFRAVMLTGTVSGAARMLYVSQPAISRLLTHTETSLGIKLFERTGGKLLPTAAAASLFEEVKHVYDAALSVDRFVENLANRTPAEISVSCSPSLGLSLMPRIIELFHKKSPKIRIHFHTTLTQDLPNELLSKKIDLAVTVLPLNHPNLVVEKLGSGRMVCALTADHPLAKKTTISVEDLQAHKTIFLSPSIPTGWLIRSSLEAHGIDLTPTIDVPRAELACALATRSLGIAIVDEFSVANELWSGLIVKPLPVLIQFNVNLVYPKFTVPSRTSEQFISILRDCIKLHEAGKLFV